MMEETVKKNVSQDDGATLLLNRPLVPIDEYAARENITIDLIKECGRLGIIQIRKYKGKMFVVDVPLSCPYLFEAAVGLSQEGNKAALLQKAVELAKKHLPPDVLSAKTSQKTSYSESNTGRQHTKWQLEVGNKAPARTEKTLVVSLPNPVEIQEPPDDLFDIQKVEPIEISDDILELIDESEPAKESSQSNEMPRSEAAVAGAQSRAGWFWRVAAVICFAGLLAAALGCLWFYVDRQAQIDRVEQAYTGTHRVFSAFAESSQQVRQLQGELGNSVGEKEQIRGMLTRSKEEVGRVSNELNNSRAEVIAVRSELEEARRNLENLRKSNSEVVKKLNEEMENLAGQVAELSKNAKAAPLPPKLISPVGPDDSDIPAILGQ